MLIHVAVLSDINFGCVFSMFTIVLNGNFAAKRSVAFMWWHLFSSRLNGSPDLLFSDVTL